jgi:hypothetical protein
MFIKVLKIMIKRIVGNNQKTESTLSAGKIIAVETAKIL